MLERPALRGANEARGQRTQCPRPALSVSSFAHCRCVVAYLPFAQRPALRQSVAGPRYSRKTTLELSARESRRACPHHLHGIDDTHGEQRSVLLAGRVVAEVSLAGSDAIDHDRPLAPAFSAICRIGSSIARRMIATPKRCSSLTSSGSTRLARRSEPRLRLGRCPLGPLRVWHPKRLRVWAPVRTAMSRRTSLRRSP